MVAPIIPGLNDSEMPAILAAAREAGASGAGYVMVKLATTVREVFLDWLQRTYPDRRPRIETLIRSTRAGRLNDSQFGRRQRGTGPVADLIADSFEMWTKKLGFPHDDTRLNREAFRPPRAASGQMQLF